VAEQLPAEALQIIETLPVDGSGSGNLRLRERLGLDPERYGEAAGSLKALGLVVAGRGRGGSLALSEEGQALRAQLSASAVQPSEPLTWIYAQKNRLNFQRNRKRRRRPSHQGMARSISA